MAQHMLSRRSVVAVACLAMAVASLIGFYAPSTTALPPNEVETEFFSDPAKTNLVGGKILFCNGQTYRWGTQNTPYKNVYSFPC